MTNNSPLDEHIKEKFGNYTPEVPSHIWENIIANKEKRKPAGFWFRFLNNNLLLILLGLLLIVAGIVIYRNIYFTENINTKPAITNNHSFETNNNTSNNISTETNSSQVNNSHTENKLSAENRINKTNTVLPVDKNIIPLKNKHSKQKNKNNFVSSAAGNLEQETASVAIDNNSIKKQKFQKGSASVKIKNPGITPDDISEPNSNDLLLKRLLLNLDLISAKKSFVLSVKKINNTHVDIPCPEAEKDAAGNKRYFELYGGPDYAFRSMTDTGNSAYLKKRKESSSFSSAFSAGLRYTRVFGNGMSFRTGINYSQINEKFKFAQGNIIQVIYIVNNNGDTTGNYTTTSTRYKTTYNKFRTIDVPVLVGYELGNGRLHANFNAGVIVNLYSWQKGDVLDTAYQPVSITTGKASSPYQFKTNVGIGFIGAVSVYYKLNSKWHIFAEPYFRYNFSPANKADLTLKQKYNTLGLRLGIRLDF